MIELQYSLIIEATNEPDYFGFYSPDLEGFTGIGHSIEDCIYKARWGMIDHVNLLKEQGLFCSTCKPKSKDYYSKRAENKSRLIMVIFCKHNHKHKSHKSCTVPL